MSILRVDHPDILDFISCKGRLDEVGKRIFEEIIKRIGLDEKHPVAKVIGKVINEYQLRNMNISVGLTREFKKALVHDGVYFLKNPRTGEVVKQLKAREVFRKIAEYAHKNGEPGIVDLDRINEDNPIHGAVIDSTNPCGEQPLEAWESCNLGSIVLNEHLKCINGTKEMDWDKFKDTITTAVRMLDNVIDATPYPYPHIEEKTKANRKIGLGVMGLADVMIELGISYDSQEGIEFCKLIHSKLTLFGRQASAELAREKGEFPAFKKSVFATGDENEIKYRNATVTTIAPTGTISTIADCSPAIEPIFKLAYKRNVLEGKTLYVINPLFQEVAKERRFDYPDIMQEVAESGSCRGVEGVPEDIQKLFATALDVSPDYHVDILCAAQGHLRPTDPDGVENAVSKTLNLPFEATVEDVENAFARALKGGAKGATVYRSGSRDMEVFNSINSVRFKSLVAKKKRPKQKMNAQNYRIPLPCGDFYFTVVPDENGRPFEVFFSPEHKMDCVDSGITQLCRQISLSLRCGVGVEDIVNQHLGVRCTKCEGGIGFGDKKIFSCWDALAKVLMEYMECSETRNEMLQKNLAKVLFGICPECKSELESAGGTCRTCPNCKKYYTCL